MFIFAKNIATKKFGKLRIKTPQDIFSGSNKKIWWICDCKREKLIRICNVLSNSTISCGQCNLISAEEIAKKKFGKLRIKFPQNILPGSTRKIEWICDCGREKLIKIKLVLSGESISCGQCSQITASEIAFKKFGKLRIKIPKDNFSWSTKKIEWICDCGREKLIQIFKVIHGHTTSCGQCSLISKEEIASKKFGKLRIKIPQDVKPRSHKRLLWICDCGKEKLIETGFVLCGESTSCGNCSELVKNWYIQNMEQIRALKCPIKPENFIPGGIIPLETIKNTGNPFKAICPACQNIYHPMLDNIKQGRSLTCGCSTYHISMPVIQITEYIRSLGHEVIMEYAVNKLKYDMFVSEYNILIEYNGLRWHSLPGSKERDLRKYNNAIKLGYSFMSISENEWLNNRSKVKNLLINTFK
jgi:catabolite regulation protein CreA